MKAIMHISFFMLGWLFRGFIVNPVRFLDEPTPIIFLMGLTAIILISIFDKK